MKSVNRKIHNDVAVELYSSVHDKITINPFAHALKFTQQDTQIVQLRNRIKENINS